MNNIRIIFIGCVHSSYILLLELINHYENVVGVITKHQSDYNSDFCDLTPLCTNNHIPYCYVKNVNDVNSLDFIKSLKPDICFCFGWSQLLGKELIDLFPLGIVGFHPAALPYNRGRHPIIWALALGLTETASTFFMIDTGVDSGDIISQQPVSIDYEDDAKTLYDKIMATAVNQEIELVKELKKNKTNRIKQIADVGNTWRKREKRDGEIDWRMSSRTIYNLVRSLTHPYPGAHFVYKGVDYKVWKVQELSYENIDNLEPGKILAVNADGSIDIKVSEGALRLLEYDNFEAVKGEYIL